MNASDGPRSRILLVTPSLGGGGAEQQTLRVANALDSQRFDVSVAVFRAGGAYEDRLRSSVPVYAVVSDAPASSTLTAAMASRSLRAIVRRQRPDVVLAFHTTAVLVAAWAVRGLDDVALVASVQNTLSYEVRESNRMTRAITRAAPFVLRRCEGVVALSHGVADDLSTQWDVPRSSISVVHNAGFDLTTREMAERPVELPPSTSAYTLVACGRLSPQKGYGILLRAFAKVTGEHDCGLWIVGEGPEQPELEQLADRLGVGDRVSFLGFQPNPFPYMKAADVFVLASEYEGFANVVAEAMWLGVPVAATDCDHGPREILGSESSGGRLSPVGDVDALAESISGLLRDDALRAETGAAAAARAANFSDVASAKGYENVLLGVLRAGTQR